MPRVPNEVAFRISGPIFEPLCVFAHVIAPPNTNERASSANPSRSTSSSSPFCSVDQPHSYTVEMSCPGKRSRSGSGVPWLWRLERHAGP